jgi:hypothetical protein
MNKLRRLTPQFISNNPKKVALLAVAAAGISTVYVSPTSMHAAWNLLKKVVPHRVLTEAVKKSDEIAAAAEVVDPRLKLGMRIGVVILSIGGAGGVIATAPAWLSAGLISMGGAAATAVFTGAGKVAAGAAAVQFFYKEIATVLIAAGFLFAGKLWLTYKANVKASEAKVRKAEEESAAKVKEVEAARNRNIGVAKAQAEERVAAAEATRNRNIGVARAQANERVAAAQLAANERVRIAEIEAANLRAQLEAWERIVTNQQNVTVQVAGVVADQFRIAYRERLSLPPPDRSMALISNVANGIAAPLPLPPVPNSPRQWNVGNMSHIN